ncbi:hypothetical protein QSJ18_05080 [Gordonia sp. ABSL1-1]|uniref:hypothetical protein n=1 Tax=Gordonia sp. ABSL1-1 TaxID=3053923 RepID=UPI0025738526|nr:hypothetical protein [Gordonia sp. ABSL1-1]MDL9936106.1 hypothetical protein [Gordonia sp. ABSL1-1]
MPQTHRSRSSADDRSGARPTATAARRRPSPGALLALAGAVIVIIAYCLPWYHLELDESVSVNGWGFVTGTGHDLSTGKLHWAAFVAALAAIVVALARLRGAHGDGWRLTALASLVVALAGALFSLADVPEGAVTTTGVYVTLAGSLLVAGGYALMAFTRH